MWIITVDCDEILAETFDAVLAFHDFTFNGKSLTKDLITHFHRQKMPWYETSNEYMDWYMSSFFTNGDALMSIRPVIWAKESLLKMKQLWYNFVVITGRHSFTEEYTLKWLEREFPNIFDDVVFANHWSDVGIGLNKADLMKNIGSTVLIDDSLHNCINIAEYGYEWVLLDMPRNQTEHPIKNIKRAFSRNDIEAYITGWQAANIA